MAIYEDILNDGLSWLSYGGAHPKTVLKSAYSRATICINYPEAVLMLGLAVYKFMYDYNGVEDLTYITEIIIMLQLYFLYFGLLIFQRQKLMGILERTKHFWPINTNGKQQEVELTQRLAAIRRGFKLYRYSTWTNVFMFALKPLYLNVKLPGYGWLPDNHDSILFIMYIYQIHLILNINHVMTGFNISFLSICTLLGVQFDILRERFTEILADGHGLRDKIKKTVDYHNFLLRQIKDVGDFYALFILYQCGGMTLTSSTTIYAMLFTEVNNAERTRLAFVFFYIFIMQLTICYFGQVVSDKSSTLTEGVYNSKWWEAPNKDLQFAAKLIMQVVQSRPQKFTAYMFLTASLPTFLSMYQFAYSVLTLFATLRAHNV